MDLVVEKPDVGEEDGEERLGENEGDEDGLIRAGEEREGEEEDEGRSEALAVTEGEAEASSRRDMRRITVVHGSVYKMRSSSHPDGEATATVLGGGYCG